METLILTIMVCIWLLSRDKNLHLENLALRQQLAIMKHKNKRPKIRLRDRIFWVILSRFWKNWKSVLIVVKPETVINWHRKGFKLFWAYKSRKKGPGRPSIDSETRKLIKKMCPGKKFKTRIFKKRCLINPSV
jgi:putative transposase